MLQTISGNICEHNKITAQSQTRTTPEKDVALFTRLTLFTTSVQGRN